MYACSFFVFDFYIIFKAHRCLVLYYLIHYKLFFVLGSVVAKVRAHFDMVILGFLKLHLICLLIFLKSYLELDIIIGNPYYNHFKVEVYRFIVEVLYEFKGLYTHSLYSQDIKITTQQSNHLAAKKFLNISTPLELFTNA